MSDYITSPPTNKVTTSKKKKHFGLPQTAFMHFCHHLEHVFNLKHHQMRSFHFDIDVIICGNRRCLFRTWLSLWLGLKVTLPVTLLGVYFIDHDTEYIEV